MRNQPITMPSCWRARVVCWITVSSFSLFCAPPPPPSSPLGGASMLSMSVKSSIPSWPLTTVASTNTDHMATLFKQVSITAMFSLFHFRPQLSPVSPVSPNYFFAHLSFFILSLSLTLGEMLRGDVSPSCSSFLHQHLLQTKVDSGLANLFTFCKPLFLLGKILKK